MATGIGETLVAARRQLGVALSDAAAETRVRESYLAALEEEDFAALGGDVYVKGFLRSYARFLRLDPEPLIATYRQHYERQHHDDLAGLAQQPVGPLPGERGPALIVGVGVALIAVVVLGVIGLLSRDEAPVDEGVAAPAPVETDVVVPTEVAPPPSDVASEPVLNDDPTEFLAADRLRMVVDIRGGPSWLRVAVDGTTELEGEQPEGTRLRYRADESITIRIGDPGAVRLRVNGIRVGRVGEAGVPVTKTFALEDA